MVGIAEDGMSVGSRRAMVAVSSGIVEVGPAVDDKVDDKVEGVTSAGAQLITHTAIPKIRIQDLAFCIFADSLGCKVIGSYPIIM
jgi:hypothetical protein